MASGNIISDLTERHRAEEFRRFLNLVADRRRRPRRPRDRGQLLHPQDAGQAKDRIDREERARRDAYEARLEEREAKERAAGRRLRGRKPKPPEPVEKVAVNITDPDSRIQKTQHGFIQGYSGQAVVTEGQIVIACDLSNDQTDVRLLHPMIEQARSNLEAVGVGEPIRVLVADAGYYSDANVMRESEGLPELLIATAKDWKQREPAAAHPPRGRIPKSLTPPG